MTKDKLKNGLEKKNLRFDFNKSFYGVLYLLIIIFVAFRVENYKLKSSENVNLNSNLGDSVEKILLSASFNDVSGIIAGSNVLASGVEIGSVKSIVLNTDYSADVVIEISKKVHVPIDSSISILTDGLFGKKYVSIELGEMDEYIEDGEGFDFAQDSIDTQALIVGAVDNFLGEKGVDTGKNNEPSVDKIKKDLKRILKDVDALKDYEK